MSIKVELYRVAGDSTLPDRLHQAVLDSNSNGVEVIAELIGDLHSIMVSPRDGQPTLSIDATRALMPPQELSVIQLRLVPSVANFAVGNFFKSHGTAIYPDGTNGDYELESRRQQNSDSDPDYDLEVSPH